MEMLWLWGLEATVSLGGCDLCRDQPSPSTTPREGIIENYTESLGVSLGSWIR